MNYKSLKRKFSHVAKGLKRARIFQGSKKTITIKPFNSVQVELTNNCNYRCLSCPQSIWRNSKFSASPFDRDKGFMSFELYQKIMDEVFQVSDEVNFSFFGEPMLHPEFVKYMEYLKQRPPGMRVVMNTNLSYATREIFYSLIDINLTELRISIDAATSDTYDLVRPGNHFVSLDGEARKGNRFDSICEKVEFWFGLDDHVPTRHVYTVSSKNIDDLGAYVIKWLPFLGLDDHILAKNVLTYGGKMEDALINTNPCNIWSTKMMTIDWSGRVSPCNLDTNMELTLGSVLEDDLVTIRNSDKYRALREKSQAREIVPCKTCVDANNWNNNYVFRQGDRWTPDIVNHYLQS